MSLGLGDLSVCPVLRSSSLALMADPHGNASGLGGGVRGSGEEEDPFLQPRRSGSTATSATIPTYHTMQGSLPLSTSILFTDFAGYSIVTIVLSLFLSLALVFTMGRHLTSVLLLSHDSILLWIEC